MTHASHVHRNRHLAPCLIITHQSAPTAQTGDDVEIKKNKKNARRERMREGCSGGLDARGEREREKNGENAAARLSRRAASALCVSCLDKASERAIKVTGEVRADCGVCEIDGWNWENDNWGCLWQRFYSRHFIRHRSGLFLLLGDFLANCK